MNQDDNFYPNDANAAYPPVPNPEYPQPEDNGDNNNAAKVAIALGAAGLSALAAWGIYEYMSKGAEEMGEQLGQIGAAAADAMPDENLAAANVQPTTTVVNEVHHVRHVHPHHHPHFEPGEDDPLAGTYYDMGDEYFRIMETTVNGRPVIAALGYDAQGHRVVLLDTDHDGVFDDRYVDVHDDGSWAAHMDFHEQATEPPTAVMVQDNIEANGYDASLAYVNEADGKDGDDGNDAQQGNDVQQGDQLEVARVGYITDADGNIYEAATVRYGRQEIQLVDTDGDGKYDFMGRDLNHDGSFDESEVQRLEEPIDATVIYDMPPTEDFEDPDGIVSGYYMPHDEMSDETGGYDDALNYDDSLAHDGGETPDDSDDSDPNAHLVSLDDDGPQGYYDENVGVYEQFDDSGEGVEVGGGPQGYYDENVGVYEQFDSDDYPDDPNLVEVDADIDDSMANVEPAEDYSDYNDYSEPEPVDVADTYTAPEPDYAADHAPEPDPGIDAYDI